VPLESLAEVDGMVSGTAAEALWRAAVDATGEADFGLSLGAAAHPASLGLVAPVLSNAPDLRRALAKLAAYSRLLLSAASMEISQRRERAKFTLRVHFPGSYLLRSPRQPMECTLAATVTLAGRLIGSPLPVEAVRFRHPQPERLDAHRRIFGVTPQFGAAADELEFEARVLDAKVLFAAPQELALHEQRLRAAFQRLDEQVSVRGRVKAAIAALLQGDPPTIEAIAERLNMSSRSLQRALATEGVGYRQMLDEARQELALAHLQSPSTSIAQVALLLGFSEPRAFHRAFKRWTGSTPRAHSGARAEPPQGPDRPPSPDSP
jgi:AraC-like DNA-binding protein